MKQNALTMQEIILRLQEFWADKGAMIWQPYHSEMGAGTANPATFLRVLGPEPWNVGYVEPSIRPDDSRYGDNPNRVQMHTQFQVILKPDPGNPQELYLQSLEAIGIDRSAHDLRFVEDNWESPALGAWGLGWEVWLDGQEITQFTYFQQAGSTTLDPVSVEITYGLERIAMRLQEVDHVMEIQYAPAISYGEIFLQNEFEQSTYNLERADAERVKQLFDLYEAEALALLDAGLAIPAYDYILKTSHTFNILDARGAIGVTERATYFNRMRKLSHLVAQTWLASREEQGFPLLSEASATSPAPDMSAAAWPSEGTVDFVLEIGVEELPAPYVDSAVAWLRDAVPQRLAALRLDYATLLVEGTPRRLIVRVRELSARQSDLSEWVRGPAAKIAYDAEGNLSKAGAGFARSRGAGPDELEQREVDGTPYLFALVKEAGRPAGEVLAQMLPSLLAELPWPKSMRWNSSNQAFGRPIRWIVALLDEMVVPFIFADIPSGRGSRGLRSASSPAFDIAHAGSYLNLLAQQQIVPSISQRKELIWNEASRLAAEVGGTIPSAAKADLLEEVANLVEHPTAIRGSFAADYLELPREVLVTVMRKHQRYFPIQQADGTLLPYFVTVANGAVDEETVRHGNQEVLRARYADARFFWENDTKQPLVDFRPRLDTLTFEHKLGSMLAKSNRLGKAMPAIAAALALDEGAQRDAQRAAHLSKADLVTDMVMDFTSLQGIMGRHYALRAGESEVVAEALEAQYQNEANSPVGLALGLVDRLDSLVGLFAVGKAPRSTADPFALRRAAIGVVELLIGAERRFDLRSALRAVAQTQPVDVGDNVIDEVLAFVQRRLEQWLLDRALPHDVVRAAIAERGHDPAGALQTAEQLAAVIDDQDFAKTLTAFARTVRITRGREFAESLNPALFADEEERTLWAATNKAALVLDAESDFDGLLRELTVLRDPINRYFDKVFVMAEDEALRNNRLTQLKRIADLAKGIVDLSEVRGF
ncbi:MAG: glycine--tRNA ligase subunit beta [Ardenticatenales bacterium]|nr:glycine--tRNA ligase subunit beta [Ardenticatenales bacterium]